MTLTKTPLCDFGKKADFFELKSIENKLISLNDIKGKNGTLIMFICNHCPYVKAVIDDIVDKGGTASALKTYMPNMHLGVLYAKPRGLPLADTYVEEITQNTWPVFPWDEEDKANH